MGSRRAAFSAGKYPKITPTAAEKRKATITMPALKTKGTRRNPGKPDGSGEGQYNPDQSAE